MAETKPTKVARWATDANRTLEPSSGEKDTGWQVQKKPPGRKMNWLQWVAYKWFAWLNERMIDGATAADFVVQGVDAGAGTDLDGGDLTASGGQATGDGGAEILFKVVEENQGAGTTTATRHKSARCRRRARSSRCPRASRALAVRISQASRALVALQADLASRVPAQLATRSASKGQAMVLAMVSKVQLVAKAMHRLESKELATSVAPQRLVKAW